MIIIILHAVYIIYSLAKIKQNHQQKQPPKTYNSSENTTPETTSTKHFIPQKTNKQKKVQDEARNHSI